MKVILLQDVPAMGKKNDTKEVSNGYARNFLLPRKLAVIATPQTTKAKELAKVQSEEKRAKEQRMVSDVFEKLPKINLVIAEKTSSGGQLFARINEQRIIQELRHHNIVGINTKDISFSSPIKQTGAYNVLIKKDGRETQIVVTVISKVQKK